jgi:hypothetical protein
LPPAVRAHDWSRERSNLDDQGTNDKHEQNRDENAQRAGIDDSSYRPRTARRLFMRDQLSRVRARSEERKATAYRNWSLSSS